MKRILLPMLMLMVAGALSCSGQYPQQNNHVSISPLSNNVNIQADAGNAAFDVNALASIVQKSTDPAVLEQKINDPSTQINNLDLDKDGQIDYLNVTETGKNELQVNDASVNPAVLVARLTITPDNSNNTANLQIDGAPAYCGPYYYYYRPHISFGTLLFMAYLLRPHTYYMPVYGYRHYPHYYTSRRTVVRTVYRPTRSAYTPVQRNYSRRSSFSSPSSSKRGFSVRNSSRSVGSGGFGNNRSSNSSGGFHSSYSNPSRSSYSSPSHNSYHSSSSRSSFGSSHSSGRSSFGSSRSSGRSFGRRR